MITSISRRRVDLVEEHDELDLSDTEYDVSDGVDVDVPFVVVDVVYNDDDDDPMYTLYNDDDETLHVPAAHYVAVINHEE